MRRLARRLLTLCTVASLLLCVSVSVLWVRSYWVAHAWVRTANVVPEHLLTRNPKVYREQVDVVRSSGGRLDWQRVGYGWVYRDAGVTWRLSRGASTRSTAGGRERLGFAFYHDRDPVGLRWRVAAPYWSLVLATGLLPAARGLAALRSGASGARGLCPSCGYDLRATPDRCPECGATAAEHLDGLQFVQGSHERFPAHRPSSRSGWYGADPPPRR